MSHPEETAAAFGEMLAEQIEDYLEFLEKGGTPKTEFYAGMEEAARVVAFVPATCKQPHGEWENGYTAACKHMADTIRKSASYYK